MAVINLRRVPDNLAAQLKSEAALAGLGYHDYCVVIFSNRGSMGLTLAKIEASRKKIADVSLGGGTTEGGGDPSLPRGGKAQDGHKCCGFENITTRGDGGVFDVVACERASVYYSPGGTYQGNAINRGRAYTSPFWRKVELPFTEPPLEESKLRMLEITYNPKPEEA